MQNQIAWNAYLLVTITVHPREIESEYYLTLMSLNHRVALCRAFNSCIERDLQSVMVQKRFHKRARFKKKWLCYLRRG